MAIKLFVSDIDGTMAISGKDPSEKNIAAVQDLIKARVIVTVATGRMYCAALPIAKALKIDAPIISYNGAMIKTVGGEILYSNYLAPELVVELIEFFQQKNHHLQTYSNDFLRYAEHNSFSDGYELSQRTKGDAVGWEGLKKFTENVCKVLSIFDTPEENEKLSAELKEKFAGRIDITKSHPLIAEIINPGISKAAAIKILAKKFGIEKSEIAAIGDGDNDLPMLLEAGMSIAMGNAPAEVKNACSLITDTCENDGVAEAIYKYILK